MIRIAAYQVTTGGEMAATEQDMVTVSPLWQLSSLGGRERNTGAASSVSKTS